MRLFYMVYKLANFLGRLALLRSINLCSQRTMQTELIKIGAKVIRHAHHACVQMAKVSLCWNLFDAILRRIRGLHPAVPV